MSEGYLVNCFLKQYFDFLIDLKLPEKKVISAKKTENLLLIETKENTYTKEIKYA